MKKLLFLLLLLLFAAGGFAGAIALQSDDFVLTRRKVVDAPPEKVFEYVSNFEKGEEWSPWKEMDPKAKVDISGAKSGVGAIMKWNSENKNVGEGSQEIVEVTPNQLVRTKLTFVKPFEGTAHAEFVLRPVDDGKKTEVTWTMWDKQNFVQKAMCSVFQASKELNATFDKGLNNLNDVVTGKKKTAS